MRLISGDSHCCAGQLWGVNASDSNGLFFPPSLKKKQVVSQRVEHVALFLKRWSLSCLQVLGAVRLLTAAPRHGKYIA